MKQKYSKKSNLKIRIAKQHITSLFKEARLMYKFDKKLSDRYVAIARRIAMKFKIRMPRQCKRRFCKHCYKYLMPGDNCRVRTARGKVVYYCFNCKKYMRIGY